MKIQGFHSQLRRLVMDGGYARKSGDFNRRLEMATDWIV